MSTIQLPTRDKPVEPTRIGPKIFIMYSLPKVGKTDQLVELADQQDCLIVDGEGGTQTRRTTALQFNSIEQLKGIAASITEEGKKRYAAGKRGMDMFPYKFVALDTVDKIEEVAEPYATKQYKASALGKSFQGNSILELPNGGGYYYLRNTVMEMINLFASICPYLILVVHVKEKLLLNKSNEEVKVNDISLAGKLSSIVCAAADAITYLYIDKKKELRMSFETYDGAVMGARQKYLAGKDFPFDWKTIYPEVFGEPVVAAETVAETVPA